MPSFCPRLGEALHALYVAQVISGYLKLMATVRQCDSLLVVSKGLNKGSHSYQIYYFMLDFSVYLKLMV